MTKLLNKKIKLKCHDIHHVLHFTMNAGVIITIKDYGNALLKGKLIAAHPNQAVIKKRAEISARFLFYNNLILSSRISITLSL